MNQKHQNILLASLIPAPKLMCRCSVLCGCLTQMRGKHGTIGAFDQSISKLNLCLNTWHCCFQCSHWNTMKYSGFFNSHIFSSILKVSQGVHLQIACSELLQLPHLCWVGSCHQEQWIYVNIKRPNTKGEGKAMHFSHFFICFFSQNCVSMCFLSWFNQLHLTSLDIGWY